MIPQRPINIRIRDLRQQHELTQEELAEALGLSRQSVNAMEAGRTLPSLPVALQMAVFFSVPIQNLFALEEELQQQLQLAGREMNIPSQESHLIPWTPLEEMREMFDWATPAPNNAPAANIAQTNNEVIVEMCLPGYTDADLDIEVGEDFVTIQGRDQEEVGDKQYFRREFALASFTRTLSLPALIQTELAKADMKHGVLTITLPKIREEKPKTTKLAITSHD